MCEIVLIILQANYLFSFSLASKSIFATKKLVTKNKTIVDIARKYVDDKNLNKDVLLLIN